jgi:putative transposase
VEIHVFVERLWKSVKYEEVYLRAYASVSEARAGLGGYFEFYRGSTKVEIHGRRPHSSLGRMTPDQSYFNLLPAPVAA